MLRNRILRAFPKGNPIGFVDAAGQVTDNSSSTSSITVSTDDFLLLFSHGKNADAIASYSFSGTSGIGSTTEFVTRGTTLGDSSTSYLNIAGYASVSSGGTVSMNEAQGRDAGFGIVALDGGDSVSSSTGGASASISVSGVTANDVVVIYETTQTLNTPTGTLPATPSGYTTAFSHTWTVGQGGNSQGWGTRVSYQTGLSGTVSHTVPSGSWDYIGGVIIRVYKA